MTNFDAFTLVAEQLMLKVETIALVDRFILNALVHIWPTIGVTQSNPLHMSHILFVVISNNTNTLVSEDNEKFLGLTISDDYDYRFVYHLDTLEISGHSQVDFKGADLLLENCDLHSANLTHFEVPAGSKIENGNSFASPSCLDIGVSTKGTTVNFTNYFLQ